MTMLSLCYKDTQLYCFSCNWNAFCTEGGTFDYSVTDLGNYNIPGGCKLNSILLLFQWYSGYWLEINTIQCCCWRSCAADK